MSLQPFPKRIGTTQLTFGPDGIAEHPEIATQITAIIGNWSLIEQATAMVAASCLATASVGVLYAMANAMRSSDAARAAIVAIIDHSISGSNDAAIFGAIMNVLGQERLTRNKLAHWLIGHCPDVPTKMIVADPRIMQDAVDYQHAMWLAILEKRNSAEPLKIEVKPPAMRRESIYVLSKNGAKIILRETVRCHDLLQKFWRVRLYATMQPEKADELRNLIRSEPRIQDALARMSKEKL